ncbi:hypothetical protein GIX45_25765 [Erwinia sp. CPCC 100877]|nr:hypothetical protein [Erwinia sp. CPCC 100877]
MGLKFIVSEAQARSSQATQVSSQAQQAVSSLQQSIQQFLSAPLSSKAYDSAKNYFMVAYTPICQSIIMTAEAFTSAHKKFVSEYQTTVGGEDIDEDKIQAEIDQYQELLHTIDDLIRDAKRPQPDLERRSMNAYEAMQKRKEKLEKLRTYSTQSASFFSEYNASQQELNNGIAQVKDCKVWNPSTGTFDFKKLDMSWAKPINERWKRSPIYLDKQIEAILNSSDSDAVKTAKIVKAYEDYLFNMNKGAFDEYNNARKKYGDDWFLENESINRIKEKLERELSNYLRQSGIHIKSIVRDMGDDILKAHGTKDDVSPLDYLYFASIVDTGAPLDLKTRAYNEDYDFSIWARNWTGDMSGDYLGNYLFGYFGQGFLMFDGSVLKFSAGAAQAWSDKDIAKWLENMKKGNFGDNPNDAQYIEDGIKDYKNRKGSN